MLDKDAGVVSVLESLDVDVIPSLVFGVVEPVCVASVVTGVVEIFTFVEDLYVIVVLPDPVFV